ncbi:MAG TPA: hypothetical protein VFG14_14320, partial [Chthoniobacteraceae bacterium]|nr:hypothetical protein [Chthoniobacteraceae bacterium]
DRFIFADLQLLAHSSPRTGIDWVGGKAVVNDVDTVLGKAEMLHDVALHQLGIRDDAFGAAREKRAFQFENARVFAIEPAEGGLPFGLVAGSALEPSSVHTVARAVDIAGKDGLAGDCV